MGIKNLNAEIEIKCKNRNNALLQKLFVSKRKFYFRVRYWKIIKIQFYPSGLVLFWNIYRNISGVNANVIPSCNNVAIIWWSFFAVTSCAEINMVFVTLKRLQLLRAEISDVKFGGGFHDNEPSVSNDLFPLQSLKEDECAGCHGNRLLN